MMMNKTFPIRAAMLATVLLVPALVPAQKKELSQARTYIKSGKDFDKAEKLMTDLLTNPENRDNERIYLTWYESVMLQYQAANEKLYLKQKYDTAAFYGLINRMYGITESLDSLDARPDEKGRVKLDYRKSHARDMDQLRRNLYYGGTYNLRKNDYQTAFNFFDTYIDADRQPLFTGYDYLKRDTMMPEAAYWATFCGHRMNAPQLTLKYSELALKSRPKARFTLQYVCEAYRQQNDTEAYVRTLNEGFSQFPSYPYFFPRLADYYNAHGKSDSVLVIADHALEQYPDMPLFLLAKSLALLTLERYDECVKVSEALIKKDDKLPEPYFNIATAYLNQALELEKKNEPRLYRQQLADLYAKARPHMEQYRKLVPKDQKRWAPALYRIYLNLNMGKQFEEIDMLLKK